MRFAPVVVALLSLAGLAWGDSPVTANQGRPGNQGCWPVCTSGSTVVVGPDGGAVPVNIVQSISLQVFMDGGQHVIADQGTSPWACYVAMDGGQQITVNQGTSPWVVTGTVQVFMDGGQHVIADQGTTPWACYVAMDGGQQIIVNQGTSPWVVAGTVQVFMDGGQHVIADQGTTPWVVSGILDGGFLGTVNVIFDGGFIGTTATQPCSASAEANTSVGAAAVPVPASPLTGRNWIRVCNSPFNSPPTQCICSISTCPTYVSTSVGDVLANSDCVTYNLGLADAGVPCCICNGAAKRLLSLECKVP